MSSFLENILIEEKIERLQNEIKNAEAIVVGGGAGLSTN